MAFNNCSPAEEPWTLRDEQRRLRTLLRQAASGTAQLATSEVDRLVIKAQRGSAEAEAHLLALFGDFIVQGAGKVLWNRIKNTWSRTLRERSRPLATNGIIRAAQSCTVLSWKATFVAMVIGDHMNQTRDDGDDA
jgi:hypothetical protein